MIEVVGGVVVGGNVTADALDAEKIERIRDQTGLGILITMLQFGVMTDDLAKRNMEMFASEVMPKLR